MKRLRALALGALLLLPALATADFVDIADVNEDVWNDVEGKFVPALWDSMVTVKGIVTVGTGAFDDANDIFVQDATGGVNVVQPGKASPAVAAGDSVIVTGVVSLGRSDRTYLYISSTEAPGSSIDVRNTGNALPEPVELSTGDIKLRGEAYEGLYATVRSVSLSFTFQWPTGPCTENKGAVIAAGDTSASIWFDKDTDLCGSPRPADSFDVIGVIVPDPTLFPQPGHGIMPPARSFVLSLGSGSGACALTPEVYYTGATYDLAFAFTGEASVLDEIRIEIPSGWSFSGDASDVALTGDAFTAASVVADPSVVTIEGAALASGAPGTVIVSDVTAPPSAGEATFGVATAVPGEEPVEIAVLPTVRVGAIVGPGDVVLNEILAHGPDSRDRSEFIELRNVGGDTVDLSGWVLVDVESGGVWGVKTGWAFPYDPPTLLEPGDYLVVAKDMLSVFPGNGYDAVFGSLGFDDPDFEMYDDDYTNDRDDPTVPNMILVVDPDDDIQSSQELSLYDAIGGTGVRVAGSVCYDAVFLYSDASLASLVDAFEYRNAAYLPDRDAITDVEGLGGVDDAWIPGPPPRGYSLGREPSGVDTDSSRDDLFLCATPTPGEANVTEAAAPPGAALPPRLSRIESVGTWYAVAEFNEPLDPAAAVDPANYDLGGGLTLEDIWLSRDGRTVLFRTSAQDPPPASYPISISGGVTDLAGTALADTAVSFVGFFTAMTPIEEIQGDQDEMGYSRLWGQEASVMGFTTVPPGVFQPDRTNMYVQDVEGWGLNVYNSDPMPQPALEGDLVRASGLIVEYRSVDSENPWSTPPGSSTEISGAAITVVARGFDVIVPEVLPTGDVGSEDREGTLVQTEGTVVSVEGFAFYIDDGTGAAQVYQNFSDLDFSPYALGDSVRVVGVVLQYDRTTPYFDGYELAPRYPEDLELKAAPAYVGSAKLEAAARILDARSGETIEITYAAPRSSHVAVRIFDLKGRPIATIYDGFSLGRGSLSWDGRSDDGSRVPAGVYICHIQAKQYDRGEVTESSLPIVVGLKLN